MNAVSQSGLMNAGGERGAAVMPPRSAAATPAECHLGLLGTLGQHGRGGQSQEDQQQLDMYMYTRKVPYRVGSFAFPAIWIESFLLLGQSLGLHGVHPPLLALHLLPLVAQNDADGSGAGKERRNKDWKGPYLGKSGNLF